MRDVDRAAVARRRRRAGAAGAARPFARARQPRRCCRSSRGGDADGACLIEPAVRCNHCGYCQSYGH